MGHALPEPVPSYLLGWRRHTGCWLTPVGVLHLRNSMQSMIVHLQAGEEPQARRGNKSGNPLEFLSLLSCLSESIGTLQICCSLAVRFGKCC